MCALEIGTWLYSPEHGELCRVIETQTLWGETVCRVWLPGKDTVVRLPAARLRPNVSRRSLTWHNEALSRYGDSESWK